MKSARYTHAGTDNVIAAAVAGGSARCRGIHHLASPNRAPSRAATAPWAASRARGGNRTPATATKAAAAPRTRAAARSWARSAMTSGERRLLGLKILDMESRTCSGFSLKP